jgi:hypothetical protein
MAMEICPDCHAVFDASDGPTHAYIGASPACWNAFSLLNVGEPPISGARLGPLMVDAYAAQHPGGDSPQATQSVACHLITLAAILDGEAALADAVRLRKVAVDLGRRAGGFPALEPPTAWPITIRTVLDTPDPAARGTVVDGWVRSVLTAWRTEHDTGIDVWKTEAPHT